MQLKNNFLLWVTLLSTLLCITLGILYRSIGLALIPVAILAFILSLNNITHFATALIISTALSIPISYFIRLPFDVFMPSEIYLVLSLLLFSFLWIKQNIPSTILSHPITLTIGLFLAWSFLVSFFSELPNVSFKASLVRLWYFAGFFLLPLVLFHQQKISFTRWVTIFMGFLSIVIFYALFRHYYYGIWIKKIAYWSASPFLPDHTAYGALLAMFVPMLTMFAFDKSFSKSQRTGYSFLLVLFSAGLLFSYSRAAWLSLMIGFIFILLTRLRLSIKTFGMLILLGIILVIAASDTIINKLEQNQKTSSLEFKEHFQSATNITTDISNLERINRWKSAIRMFEERPFVGFGPGTFMFCYAPYQMSYDKTPISTNSGDLGNAHSEYLGNLSEMGIMGLLSFLAIIFLVLYKALRLLEELKGTEYRLLLGAISGLVTYFSHALVNNFLDIDKIAFGFWGFIAFIVYMDIETALRKGTQDPEG